MNNSVFVFGSNLAGRHGKGAAQDALKNWGAVYGQGIGLQGQSYAIPTKDEKLKTLPLDIIEKYVLEFIKFSTEHSDTMFLLTPIGTGLAGYDVKQIQPLFKDIPSNVFLYNTWIK